MEYYEQTTIPIFQFLAPAGQEEEAENSGAKLSLGKRGVGGRYFSVFLCYHPTPIFNLKKNFFSLVKSALPSMVLSKECLCLHLN